MINLFSLPFDSQLDGSTYDRAMTAAEFARYLSSFSKNGIIVLGDTTLESELQVTDGGGMVVNIDIGAIHINGRVGWRDSSVETLTLDAGGANPRIDRIVAEMNATVDTRAIIIKVVKGVEDANPTPPSLIQTEEVYQLSLAQVNVDAGAAIIASIVDERFNEDVCGVAKTNGLSLFEQENNFSLYDKEVVTYDANLMPTEVNYKRKDGTIAIQQLASNPDVNGYYQTIIEKYVANDGATIYKTITYTLSYLSNGIIETSSMEVSY
jgi:hypothetical protein